MPPVENRGNRQRRRERERAGGSNQKTSKRKHDGDDLCAICDNGGNVICCDGGCLRSFHLDAEAEDSEESKCRLALGLSKQRAKMILDDHEKVFICKNCKYKEHQCFACGMLGSSDLSSGTEVFQCKDQDCGHFYHPKCIAKLLYSESMSQTLFEQHVAAGQKFLCPAHECTVCKGGERKGDRNMQFAVCRRCPTTYHRKCLPSDIPFETKTGRNGYMQRAWDHMEGEDGVVIPCDPIIIYCMEHEIIKSLGTPKRSIIFPIRPCVPKTIVSPPMEQDSPGEEPADNPLSEPAHSPSAARDQDRCCCSSPIDSFAPSSLFTHPHPGNGGWLGD